MDDKNTPLPFGSPMSQVPVPSGVGPIPPSTSQPIQQPQSAGLPMQPAQPGFAPSQFHPQSSAVPFPAQQQVVMPAQPALAPVAPTMPMPQAPAHAVAQPAQQLQPDQIDEQWTLLAHDVIAKTQHDPYLQSSELAKVKAGYLHARYGKDIRLPEDAR